MKGTKKIRGAVFSAVGSPIQLMEFDPPVLSSGEVFVRVNCCTLCGSDLHSIGGKRSVPMPSILGHEICGTVAELSSTEAATDVDGTPLRLGDRIVWSVAASCGNCERCLHGMPQKCHHLHKYGHSAIRDGYVLSGGLAEGCHLLKGSAIVKVPSGLSDSIAATASCATPRLTSRAPASSTGSVI